MRRLGKRVTVIPKTGQPGKVLTTDGIAIDQGDLRSALVTIGFPPATGKRQRCTCPMEEKLNMFEALLEATGWHRTSEWDFMKQMLDDEEFVAAYLVRITARHMKSHIDSHQRPPELPELRMPTVTDLREERWPDPDELEDRRSLFEYALDRTVS